MGKEVGRREAGGANGGVYGGRGTKAGGGGGGGGGGGEVGGRRGEKKGGGRGRHVRHVLKLTAGIEWLVMSVPRLNCQCTAFRASSGDVGISPRSRRQTRFARLTHCARTHVRPWQAASTIPTRHATRSRGDVGIRGAVVLHDTGRGRGDLGTRRCWRRRVAGEARRWQPCSARRRDTPRRPTIPAGGAPPAAARAGGARAGGAGG